MWNYLRDCNLKAKIKVALKVEFKSRQNTSYPEYIVCMLISISKSFTNYKLYVREIVGKIKIAVCIY